MLKAKSEILQTRFTTKKELSLIKRGKKVLNINKTELSTEEAEYGIIYENSLTTQQNTNKFRISFE